MNTLTPDIERICHRLIDNLLAKGEVDFVTEFAEPVPLTVIAEQLGVSLDDYDLFKTWSDAFVAQLSGLASKDQQLESARLIVDFQHYFAEAFGRTPQATPRRYYQRHCARQI